MNITQEGYKNKVKNKLFSCLCERESGSSWETLLDSIIIEWMGLPEASRTIDYYMISHKLMSCRYLSYKYFRKTIFDIMNLLTDLDMED